MTHKLFMLCTVLLTSISTNNHTYTRRVQLPIYRVELISPEQKSHVIELLKQYGISGSIAAGVGTSTGALCAYLENKHYFPFISPLSWLLLSCLRIELIDAIRKDLRKRDIDKETFMQLISWISDWLTYIAVKEHYQPTILGFKYINLTDNIFQEAKRDWERFIQWINQLIAKVRSAHIN